MKNTYWAIGAIAIMIVGFVALQIYLHIDLQNFKEKIAGSPKVETETPTTPKVVVSDEKPEDVPGFKWVRHGDHWNKVPIDNPDQPNDHPPVQRVDVYDEVPEGWDLPIPEGSDPSDIDIEKINALRKKVFSGLTISEVHQLEIDTLTLSPSEQKIFEFARYAELFSHYPDLAEEWRQTQRILKEMRTQLRDRGYTQ